jgi:hypothetical protein
VPVLLNTSFNNFAEPIVETPEDALICFLTTGLHALVLENWIVQKKPRQMEAWLRLIPMLADHAKLHETGAIVPVTPPAERQRRGRWARLRARLSAAATGGPSRAPSPVVGNTHDSREHPIGEDVFRVLARANGCRRLDELMTDAGVRDGEARAACLGVIEQLWERRLLRLHP